MTVVFRSLILVLALLTGPQGEPGGTPGEGVRYAFFPMRNLTADRSITGRIRPLLSDALCARGATFTPEEQLEEVLRDRRIRYTDSLSREAAGDIRRSTGAQYVLVSTVLAFEPSPEPVLSIALRVIDARDGRRAQSSVVSLRGEDFTGLLGLGTIYDEEELLLEVLPRLLSSFDAQGAPVAGLDGPGDDVSLPSADQVSCFVKEGFDASSIERLAVLPFSNRTEAFDAGTIAAELFGHKCFHVAGIQVVEQAELRASMIRAEIRSIDQIDSALLARMGRELDTRYFALGSVDRFQREVIIHSDSFPEIEATVRIIDVEADETMCAASVHRSGYSYEGLLELGGVRDPISLALRVTDEIIMAIGIE